MLNQKFTVKVICIATLFGLVATSSVQANEPGWSPVILPTGDYRDQIKSMPIEQRPYRPLHFYGNTVRRNFYRGNPVPMPRDLRTTTGELVRRR